MEKRRRNNESRERKQEQGEQKERRCNSNSSVSPANGVQMGKNSRPVIDFQRIKPRDPLRKFRLELQVGASQAENLPEPLLIQSEAARNYGRSFHDGFH